MSKPVASATQCKYCLVFAHEATFYRREMCASCEARRRRYGEHRCGSLLMRDGTCIRCDPVPDGMVEVIVLDAASERERTVRRRRFGGKSGNFVSILDRQYTTRDLDEDEPLVVSLPTEQWVKVRI